MKTNDTSPVQHFFQKFLLHPLCPPQRSLSPSIITVKLTQTSVPPTFFFHAFLAVKPLCSSISFQCPLLTLQRLTFFVPGKSFVSILKGFRPAVWGQFSKHIIVRIRNSRTETSMGQHRDSNDRDDSFFRNFSHTQFAFYCKFVVFCGLRTYYNEKKLFYVYRSTSTHNMYLHYSMCGIRRLKRKKNT